MTFNAVVNEYKDYPASDLLHDLRDMLEYFGTQDQDVLAYATILKNRNQLPEDLEYLV